MSEKEQLNQLQMNEVDRLQSLGGLVKLRCMVDKGKRIKYRTLQVIEKLQRNSMSNEVVVFVCSCFFYYCCCCGVRVPSFCLV